MMYSLEMLTKKRKFGRFGRSILGDLGDRPAKNPRKIAQIAQIARVIPPYSSAARVLRAREKGPKQWVKS